MEQSDAMEMEEEAAPVNLGFLDDEAVESSLESHHLFGTGKVGGRPAWLAMENIPTTICSDCDRPLVFLLQVYAPVEDGPEDCFHRSLFLFVCRASGCGALRAFRSQIPRENPFYAFDPIAAEEVSTAKQVQDFTSLCFVCGSPGTKKCGRCGKVWYCHKLHQAAHWKAGHREECSAEEPVQPAAKAAFGGAFPQAGLAIEEEELDADFDPAQAFAEDCDDEEDVPDQREAKEKCEDDEDIGEGLTSTADPTFEAFRARLNQNPEQIIRYQRRGRPLWASKTQPEAIPACELCGGPRSFECQVMPGLLEHLGVDEVGAGSLDWATLALFTCDASCSLPPTQPYAQEFLFHQRYQ